MRSLFGLLVTYLLGLLLVGTSPMGTGQGVHQDQLLDALVPHVHLVDGKSVAATATQGVSGATRSGTALGAGAGAAGGAAAAAGMALLPPRPTLGMMPPPGGDVWRLAPADNTLPRGQTVTPPDPPPLFPSQADTVR
jgi:hypothetical protein